MLQTGHVIQERFRLSRLHSHGGQGVLYRGRDELSRQDVAIKVSEIHYDPARRTRALERQRREGSIGRHVQHPAIVVPTHVGVADGHLFSVYPWIDGHNLVEAVQLFGSPTVDQAIEVITAVSSGLGAAHAAGIVHRDIKPQNILRSAAGEFFLIDFGVCRTDDASTFTDADDAVGSLQFMAPEQLADPRRVTPQSDIYALAAVLYYLLTNAPPTAGQNKKQVAHNLMGDWMPPPPHEREEGIPESISDVCMKGLAKYPAHRFVSVGEFQTALMGMAAPMSNSAQTGVVRGVVTVPSHRYHTCHAEHDRDASFCPSCGSAVGAGPAMRSRCLACGADMGPTKGRYPAACTRCGREFGSRPPKIVFDQGPLASQMVLAPLGFYVVGRAELSPGDSRMSRRHITITRSNGRLRVQDASSKNGTWVNGMRACGELDLPPHNRIKIGSSEGQVL